MQEGIYYGTLESSQNLGKGQRNKVYTGFLGTISRTAQLAQKGAAIAADSTHTASAIVRNLLPLPMTYNQAASAVTHLFPT